MVKYTQVSHALVDVDKFIVVGGGTSGLISALILNTRFPKKKVQLIQSSNVGIVGVGESSTEHISDFCVFVGIDLLDLVKKTNATFKLGVYFDGWSDKDYLHGVSPTHSQILGCYYSYYHLYAHLISNNLDTFPTWWSKQKDKLPRTKESPTRQFQFDTFALNEYLLGLCRERNIDLVWDDIVGVKNEQEIIGKSASYTADFFIDCSGFKRILSKDVSWKSYSDYFPVNSAIAFPTDEMDEYNLYTKATARNSGWSWTIPTQTRTGNGYVFSDKFISVDQAHQEMEDVYGHEIKEFKSFKFDPGRLETAWNNNCLAVGLSQSFVEPLEATSIGNTIQEMFCFVHYLPSYDIDTCNSKINDMFDNIVDFVQSHYLIEREDTPFWKSVKYDLKLTDNLQSYLKMWKNRLPQPEDFYCSWGLFEPVNYIPVLYGLGWFDIDKIRDEYLEHGLTDKVNMFFNQDRLFNDKFIWMGHKEIINSYGINKSAT